MLSLPMLLSLVDQKQRENVDYFIHLGSMITNDARCTREITSSIALAKSSLQQDEGSFHQQIGLKFKDQTGKVLLSEHSFV